jgi:uncharacterized protein (DUF433 family)
MMSAAVQYPHITFDADGTARVGLTRYKVLHLAGEHYHYGWSAEEMLRQHVDLKPQEIYAALTFFYDHRADFVQQLNESTTRAKAARGAESLSRDELVRRKAVPGQN